MALLRRTQYGLACEETETARSQRWLGAAPSLKNTASSGPRVRLREDYDDEALLRLFNEDSFQHYATHLKPFASVQSLRNWMAGFGPERFEIVVEIDSEAAGFAGLYVLPDRQNHVGWFFLAVRERFQSKGLGKKLLQTLIAAADILFGLARLQLTVFCDNEIAIKLYRNFDFEVEGRHSRVLRRGEDFVDAFSMARARVGAGAPNSHDELVARCRRLAPFIRLSCKEESKGCGAGSSAATRSLSIRAS